MAADVDVLRNVTLGIYQPPKEIWDDSVVVVESLHRAELGEVAGKLDKLRQGVQQNIVLQGRPGTGKSHFLGRLRREVMAANDLFVAVHLTTAGEFWRGVVGSYLDAFHRPKADGVSQLATLLDALLRRMRVPDTIALPVVANAARETELKTLKALWPTFVRRAMSVGGAKFDVNERTLCDVAQAMVLFNSEDFQYRDIGEAFCQGLPIEAADARAAQLRTMPGADGDVRVEPREVVRAFDALVKLSGHVTVCAIDQLDGLLASAEHAGETNAQSELLSVANGLMDLSHDAQNTLVVLSCILDSWVLISEHSVKSVAARFPVVQRLGNLPSPAAGEELIATLLGRQYEKQAFTPPYPTWPIRRSAFAAADELTPRLMIEAVLKHIDDCVRSGAVSEMVDPPWRSTSTGARSTAPAPPPIGGEAVAAVADRFEALRSAASTDQLMSDEGMETLVPQLLYAGLVAWTTENSGHGCFELDPITSAKSAVHARMRQIIDRARADEIHWCFFALPAKNALAQQSRLQKAMSATGLGSRRHLVIVRNTPWNTGPKTRKLVDAFAADGGRTVELRADDAAVLVALHRLIDERSPALGAWLLAQRPASSLTLFADCRVETAAAPPPSEGDDAPPENGHAQAPETKAALRKVAQPMQPREARGAADQPERATTAGKVAATSATDSRHPGSGAASPPRAEPRPSLAKEPRLPAASPPAAVQTAAPSPVAPTIPAAIPVGRTPDGRRTIHIRLEDLRRHACIFAGSGSGKTVLIRRIVEECALNGVSSIVLDPNNDLARLGTPWPSPPAGWGPGDAQRATEYFDTVETVIWTPRIGGGRPLAFAPLAGLKDVADDPQEFAMAIDNAVGMIAPRTGLPGRGGKSERGRAILRQAVASYVRGGGDRLLGFLGFLNALPDGVSQLDNADKLAAEMAQTLLAQTVNDPMFGDHGQAVDPALLLNPSPGRRARVSVISLVGLPGDDQRQSFVSQLQMALFSWVKRNPAGDRPLGGLFVMDEAQTLAPSGSVTASTATTLALASQARKYGLGLIFATQAPKGLHNRISGNATTQIYGLLNASAQIEAARDLAAAKGGTMPGISTLRSGEFYIAGEGLAFERMNAPMCLSFHPKSPLSQQEVVALAAA